MTLLSLPRRQQLGAREEEGQLDGRVLGRVAAVDGVALDRRTEGLADRSLPGLRDVRRSHHLPQVGHRVLPLQRHRYHRTAGHELHQAAVERTLLVHLVEGPRLGLREPQHLQAADDEAFPLQMGEDTARVARSHAVRLQNRQRHLHLSSLPCRSCSTYIPSIPPSPPSPRNASPTSSTKPSGPSSTAEPGGMPSPNLTPDPASILRNRRSWPGSKFGSTTPSGSQPKAGIRSPLKMLRAKRPAHCAAAAMATTIPPSAIFRASASAAGVSRIASSRWSVTPPPTYTAATSRMRSELRPRRPSR